jgi:hypothetical protein
MTTSIRVRIALVAAAGAVLPLILSPVATAAGPKLVQYKVRAMLSADKIGHLVLQ